MSLRRRSIWSLIVCWHWSPLFGDMKADTMISITGPYQALSQEISGGNSLFFGVKVFFEIQSSWVRGREVKWEMDSLAWKGSFSQQPHFENVFIIQGVLWVLPHENQKSETVVLPNPCSPNCSPVENQWFLEIILLSDFVDTDSPLRGWHHSNWTMKQWCTYRKSVEPLSCELPPPDY